MPTNKKAVLTSQLPPTPCTLEMRTQIYNVALVEGVSIAEIQRKAFALFLSTFDSKSTKYRNDNRGAVSDEGKSR